jgi:putative phage-type endonuclease
MPKRPITLPVRQGTPEWEEARRAGIGSSDAPVVLGLSTFRSPYELWAEKVGLAPAAEPDADTALLFRIGHLMEPVLLELYAEQTGRKVRRRPRMIQHADRPWMLASLDGSAGSRIVEAKWTNAKRWDLVELPLDVEVQVQHQLEVAGAEVADVVALVAGKLRIIEVARDADLIADMLELEDEFYRRNVLERIPPDIDGSEATARALARAYPRGVASPLLKADEDFARVAEALRTATADAAAAETTRDTIRNAIRAMMGPASGVEGDGFRITWTQNRPSRVVDWKGLAAEIEERFPDEVEELRERFTTDKDGAVVLRAWWKPRVEEVAPGLVRSTEVGALGPGAEEVR